MKRIVVGMLAVLVLAFTCRGADEAAWPSPVPGFVPVKPGEHPRLLFRKSDLPAIRERAKTEEGQKIVARLRATLGGGEAMPTRYNEAKRAYEMNTSPEEGTFTISHMAGFGMLYQLTGDKKYAELGRQCFLKGKEGVRDRDNRYAQEGCDGELRLGPSLAMIALGYDLCYDGWDEAFRREVALYLQNYTTTVRTKNEELDPKLATRKLSLADMVKQPAHGPNSNHHAAIIAGAGFTVLGIKGDPGTDAALLKEWDELCQDQLRTKVPLGFGPYGFYAEGQGPSHVGVNSALVPYVQALRVAEGRDYVTNSTMVQWLTLRWVMEMLRDGEGHAWYPARHELMSTGYGREQMLAMNGGMTHGGWFSQGFGAIPDRYKPSLLWTYNTFAAADDGNQFDTRNYPHRAIMALVNWPIGVKPQNPGAVMPHAIYDSLHGYYAIRNRWQDGDDVLITLFAKLGSYRQRQAWQERPTKIFGVGQKVELGMVNGIHDFMATAPDGSTSIRWPAKEGSKGASPVLFAVDFSRRAGVEAVVVTTLSGGGDVNSLRVLDRKIGFEAGKRGTLNCLTLSLDNRHPSIVNGTVDGQPAVFIGGLAVVMNDGKLAFRDVPGVKPGLGDKPVDAGELKTIKMPTVVKVEEKDVAMPKDASLALSFDTITEDADGQVYVQNDVDGKSKIRLHDVEVVPGVIGNGLRFGDKGFGVIPAGMREATPCGRNGFSLSYWLYLDQKVSGNFMVTDWFWRANSQYSGSTFAFNSYKAKLTADYAMEPGKWCHVAWVLDPSAKRFTCWINGALASEGEARAIDEFEMHGGIGAAVIDEDYLGSKAQWPGRLDELRLFKRPLTPGEVVALYRQGMDAIRNEEANGNLLPVALIVTDTTRGAPPLNVSFDGSQTRDPEGDALRFEWDFGDGAKASGPTATHAFDKVGAYTVVMTARDARGGVARAAKTIRVENRAPEVHARIGWNWMVKQDKKNPLPGDVIVLDGGDAVDPEAQPLKCTWTVNGKTHDGAMVKLKLPDPGAYPVTFVADDGTGQTTTWRSVLNVPTAEGMSLAEAPKGPLTPGLFYRYWHLSPRLRHNVPAGFPSPVDFYAMKRAGTAETLQVADLALRGGRYAIDWAGYITVPKDGAYTFHADVQGGLFLWIGSRYIGGANEAKGPKPRDITVNLQKGTHRFGAIFLASDWGQWGMSLEWSGPGIERQLIPSSVFSRSLTIEEQRAVGTDVPVVGTDVMDRYPVSVEPNAIRVPAPPRASGSLELKCDAPAADGYVTMAAKAPAGFQEPIAYTWEFGDGMKGDGPSVGHRYLTGPCTVTVRAEDAIGRSMSAFQVVRVPEQPSVECIGLVAIRTVYSTWWANMVAGVIPQGYWNPIGDKTLANLPCRDNRGRPTTVTVGPVKQDPYAPAVQLESQNMDALLMSQAGGMRDPIEIKGIPYARYDLILICPGSADKRGVKQDIGFKVGGQTLTARTANAPCDYDGRFVEETEARPEGNYVVFRGLTGPIQTIEFVGKSSAHFVSAIQIVNAPR